MRKPRSLRIVFFAGAAAVAGAALAAAVGRTGPVRVDGGSCGPDGDTTCAWTLPPDAGLHRKLPYGMTHPSGCHRCFPPFTPGDTPLLWSDHIL